MLLSDAQTDALKELTNIGLGRAAGILNSMLDMHIELSIPNVKGVDPQNLKTALEEIGSDKFSLVEMKFQGDYGGAATLIFPPQSAPKLVEAITKEKVDASTLNTMHIETLNEIGNVVLNGVIGSFSNMLSSSLTYNLPNYSENSLDKMAEKYKNQTNVIILLIQTKFEVVDQDIEGHIMLLFEVSSFDALLASLDSIT